MKGDIEPISMMCSWKEETWLSDGVKSLEVLVLSDDSSRSGEMVELVFVLLRRVKYCGMDGSSDIRLHCAFPKSVDALGHVAKAGNDVGSREGLSVVSGGVCSAALAGTGSPKTLKILPRFCLFATASLLMAGQVSCWVSA